MVQENTADEPRTFVLVKKVSQEILDLCNRVRNMIEESKQLLESGKRKIKIQHPDIDPDEVMQNSPQDIEVLAKVHGGGYSDLRKAVFLASTGHLLQEASKQLVFATYEETMRRKTFRLDMEKGSEHYGSLLAVLDKGEVAPGGEST